MIKIDYTDCLKKIREALQRAKILTSHWFNFKALMWICCSIILITLFMIIKNTPKALASGTGSGTGPKSGSERKPQKYNPEQNDKAIQTNTLSLNEEKRLGKNDIPIQNVMSIQKDTSIQKNTPIQNNTSIQNNAPTQNNTPVYVMVYPNDSTTFSSETTATAQKINVKEGDKFESGSILIQLDCRVQQADLNKALAQQKLADSALKSAQKLNSYGSISETEMIKAQSEAEIANADVEKLSAILDKCIIKAPFKGAVSDLFVHVGETVKAGDPLVKIVSSESLELHMQVPSMWLQWLHVGALFNFHVNELNINYQGKITKINPEINPVSQTIKIIGVLTNPNNKLLPGMSGQATFTGKVALKITETTDLKFTGTAASNPYLSLMLVDKSGEYP